MTISNPSNRVVFTGPGNGFAYNRPVFDVNDMYVEILTTAGDTIIPALNGIGEFDFTVTGSFDSSTFRFPNGVTVTLNNDLPAGDIITIENRVALVQLSDYVNGGPLNAERLETDLDRLVVMAQAPANILGDVVRISPASGFALPPLTPAPSEFLRWNSAGTAIEAADITPTGSIGVPVSIQDGGTGATTILGAQRSLEVDGSVETIVDLTFITKADLNDGDVKYVHGRNVDGDGAGGFFRWDAASTDAADNGTVFQADEAGTGRWKRLYTGDVNLRWFGAVGDDTTDDHAAFDAALDSIIAAGGAPLHIPKGVYRIKGKLSKILDAQQHITIKGDGRYQSILDFSDAVDLGVEFQATQTTDNQHPVIEIRDIGLITSRENAGPAIRVSFASDNNVDASVMFADLLIAQNFDRLSDDGTDFGYWSDGIHCTNARNGEIRNLHMFGELNLNPGTDRGIHIDGESTAFVITDSLIIECATGIEAADTSEGLYVHATDVVFCRNGVIHNADVLEPQATITDSSFNCANNNVWLINSQGSVIANCMMFATAVLDTPGPFPTWTGVLFQGPNSAFNKVIGCTFTKEAQRTGDITTGIDFNEGSDYSATGNHFFGFSGNQLTFGIQARAGVANVNVGDDNIFVECAGNVTFDPAAISAISQPLVQFGTAAAVSGSVINFPSAFRHSIQRVVATHRGTNTALNVVVDALTTTGFTVHHNSGGPAVNIDYIAVGY